MSPRNLKDSNKDYSIKIYLGGVVECELFFFEGHGSYRHERFFSGVFSDFFSKDGGSKIKPKRCSTSLRNLDWNSPLEHGLYCT